MGIPGHGHTTTCYEFWQHYSHHFVPVPERSYFVWYLFYFIHVYIAPGQGETTLGDIFFYGSRKVLSLWSLVACFKKYICPLIICTFFHGFILGIYQCVNSANHSQTEKSLKGFMLSLWVIQPSLHIDKIRKNILIIPYNFPTLSSKLHFYQKNCEF